MKNKMMGNSLITSEFQKFNERILFGEITIKDLSLKSSGSYRLIDDLKNLINKNFDFFDKLGNTDLLYIVKEKLETIYQEFSKIFIDNYDEKKFIIKMKNSRELYEKIMTFFLRIFQKFEII